MNTRNFSLANRSAIEQLEKAKRKHAIYSKSPLDAELADELAEEIWKCTDYFHRENICDCDNDSLKKCQQMLRDKCASLGAINDICDSSKHAGIDRKICTLKSVKNHKGAFSNGYSPAFDISALLIFYEDDERVCFQEAAKEAMLFLSNLVTPNPYQAPGRQE